MEPNQPPWPREWLMTDERIGDRLWAAADALPAGGGIVFRHYATPRQQRDRLARRISDLCRERDLILAIARDVALAGRTGADLVHNPSGDPGRLPTSRSAHSYDEAMNAAAAQASLIFLSPIRATRSHPQRKPLPSALARKIVSACPVPVIALGGMNRAHFQERKPDGFHGWAGIDAWLGG